MGYKFGSLSKASGRGRLLGEKYEIDSFRIGKCQSGDKWESCSGGCNDYEAGASCNNNRASKCDKDQAVKIAIECNGGDYSTNASCEGKRFNPIRRGPFTF